MAEFGTFRNRGKAATSHSDQAKGDIVSKQGKAICLGIWTRE